MRRSSVQSGSSWKIVVRESILAVELESLVVKLDGPLGVPLLEGQVGDENEWPGILRIKKRRLLELHSRQRRFAMHAKELAEEQVIVSNVIELGAKLRDLTQGREIRLPFVEHRANPARE